MVTKVIVGQTAFDILIWFSQPDYVFIAEVMQLPTCRTEGLTQEQALENIQKVIRCSVGAGSNLSPPSDL